MKDVVRHVAAAEQVALSEDRFRNLCIQGSVALSTLDQSLGGIYAPSGSWLSTERLSQPFAGHDTQVPFEDTYVDDHGNTVTELATSTRIADETTAVLTYGRGSVYKAVLQQYAVDNTAYNLFVLYGWHDEGDPGVQASQVIYHYLLRASSTLLQTIDLPQVVAMRNAASKAEQQVPPGISQATLLARGRLDEAVLTQDPFLRAFVDARPKTAEDYEDIENGIALSNEVVTALRNFGCNQKFHPPKTEATPERQAIGPHQASTKRSVFERILGIRAV